MFKDNKEELEQVEIDNMRAKKIEEMMLQAEREGYNITDSKNLPKNLNFNLEIEGNLSLSLSLSLTPSL